MGVCLSCLGLSKESDSDVGPPFQPPIPRGAHGNPPANLTQPSETSRLLNSGSSQPQYGSSNGPTPHGDLAGSKQDPERERREREALNAIWKSTSDKLIDISSTAAEHAAAGTAEINFASLFRETFPRRQPRPAAAANGDAGEADSQRGVPWRQSPQKAVDEQTWLRDIIMRDPGDKSWDCNTVHKIGKPLIIEFDDMEGKDESGAARALKESRDKSK